MPRRLSIYQIDAFATRLFSGNSTVVILGQWRPDDELRSIAAE